MKTYQIRTYVTDNSNTYDPTKEQLADIIEFTLQNPPINQMDSVFSVLKQAKREGVLGGEEISWNDLNPVQRQKIARAAGFSESDCAFAAKIKWEGFPQQIVDALYLVDWEKVLA